MRNPIGLFCILLLSVLDNSAHAQRILAAGVEEATACRFALHPLLADLESVNYPKDWTIVLACTQPMWNELQHKAKAYATNSAFTSLDGHVTVINGGIYRGTPSLSGRVHSTPTLVLRHELGHILCDCSEEVKADRAAGLTPGRGARSPVRDVPVSASSIAERVQRR